MNNYLKYLISLLLTFGLMVNDGILNSQSNSEAYYQVSYLKNSYEGGNATTKSYQFNQIHFSKIIVCPILFAHLQLQDKVNLQTRILIKLRIALYQNIRIVTGQLTFLSKTITSSNQFSHLYIA